MSQQQRDTVNEPTADFRSIWAVVRSRSDAPQPPNTNRRSPHMSNIDSLLPRNVAFAAGDVWHNTPRLPFLPHKTLYVITCIDPRVDPAEFLGLEFAEAIVARTVGGRVTPAVIQDVAYIGYLVETKAPDGPYFEAAIIHHTDCGSGLLADEELRHGFSKRTGYDSTCWRIFRCSTHQPRSAPTSSAFSQIRASHRASRCPATSTTSTPGSSRRSSSQHHQWPRLLPYRDERRTQDVDRLLGNALTSAEASEPPRGPATGSARTHPGRDRSPQGFWLFDGEGRRPRARHIRVSLLRRSLHGDKRRAAEFVNPATGACEDCGSWRARPLR
jgi:carbonic anhydrase